MEVRVAHYLYEREAAALDVLGDDNSGVRTGGNALAHREASPLEDACHNFFVDGRRHLAHTESARFDERRRIALAVSRNVVTLGHGAY
jgi:hypothetical protein